MDKTERELRDMLADHRLVAWPTEPQWNAIWLAANAPGYQGTVSAAVHQIAPNLLNPEWVAMKDVDPAEAKMLWAEICVRTSVSPFVEQNIPFTDKQKADAAFQQHYKDLTARGWTVVSNGPEGMELRSPKKMKHIDLICLIVGVLALVSILFARIFIVFALVFIAFALVDYFVYTKPETAFLARPKA